MLRLLIALLIAIAFLGVWPAAPAFAADETFDCTEPFSTIATGLGDGGTTTFNCAPGASIVIEDRISIDEDTTINGNGVTFDGNDEQQIFTVFIAGTTLILDEVTLTRARSTGLNITNGNGDPTSNVEATSEFCGAAIFMASDNEVQLTNSTLSDNRVDVDVQTTNFGALASSKAFARGAAICNEGGTLTVSNSTFSGNTAEAVALASTAAVAGAKANAEALAQGGAIYNDGGTVSIVNSTFSDNSMSVSATANAEDTATSAVESSATDVYTTGAGGSVDLNNSTAITGSMSLSVQSKSTTSDAITSSTARGSSLVRDDGAFSLFSTITDSCYTGFTSLGYNLVTNTECFTASATDQVVADFADLLLGPLQDNGGPTQTRLPDPDSPAIDQGNCPTLTTDQRGLTRVIDDPAITDAADGCDVGAVERGAALGDNFVLRNNTLAPFPDFARLQAGDPIYLRFSLGADHGLDILAPGSPFVQPINCQTGDPLGPPTSARLARGLRYYSSADYYQLIWRTQSSWANTCQQLILRFFDGSQVRFNVEFTPNR
jgi:hypothetical protein